VILREAARAAGVSHSAAYRDFTDREALLTEVSQHARNELAVEMRRRVNRTTDPLERLQAVGTAYIDFALSQPGLFRTAFSSHPATFQDGEHDLSSRLDAGSDADNAEPYEVLRDVLDEAVVAGLLDAPRRPGAEIAAWSAVHGLASLLLDGPLPTTGAALEFARSRVLDLIERGLLDGV
jgi:AcrR family transcriptional regulator